MGSYLRISRGCSYTASITKGITYGEYYVVAENKALLLLGEEIKKKPKYLYKLISVAVSQAKERMIWSWQEEEIGVCEPPKHQVYEGQSKKKERIKISQEDMAVELNMSKENYAKYERQGLDSPLYLGTFLAIAEKLEVPPTYLLPSVARRNKR